ncbi:uncharacterized protein LOC129035559 [Pongo pygmaeus]|uniref:uncharacterized protein LOC129035559 n=1 Tax=Pongo pygmaeus TaxID=9600 RepID=UPI0023E0EA17|nr:uncharacterized protein LOC129035559 [Pongo pygmaeus]
MASGVSAAPWGPLRAAPPLRPLCARRKPLCRALLLAAQPSAEKRVKGGARDKQGTGRGEKATALTLGRFRHVAFGLPRGLVPNPSFPAQPGPGRGGTGEERSHQDRLGNGASGAAGKGLRNCLGFADWILGNQRAREGLGEGP